MKFDYECALTGVTEQGSLSSASDQLDDLPVGWTKITIARRQVNPKWLMIQQVKQAMIEGLTSQFPPDIADMQRYAIQLQVEAQFFGIEQSTPMYVRDVDDVVYLSDSGDIVDTVNEIRSTLGLDPLVVEEEEEQEEGKDDKVPEIEEKSST